MPRLESLHSVGHLSKRTLIGLVPSVIFGGCMTLVVVATVARLVPELRRLTRSAGGNTANGGSGGSFDLPWGSGPYTFSFELSRGVNRSKPP